MPQGVRTGARAAAARAGRVDDNGVFVLADGSRYEGAMERGVMHGHGHMTHPNGDRRVPAGDG